jgi:Flp pilus assembly protein TadG
MRCLKRWSQQLSSKERRRSPRQAAPNVVAYHWTGCEPIAHGIRDISSAGFYMVTEEKWHPGTLVTMTLQRTDLPKDAPGGSIVIQTRIVRRDEHGMAGTFLVGSGTTPLKSLPGTDKPAFLRFLARLRDSGGQALIEYLLVLPLILLLIVNLVNFGGFFFAWITVANAARSGANYAILGGASVGSLSAATASQISSVITSDISSLPNSSSLSVNICQNYDGTVTTLSGTCTSVPSDPEPSSYILTSVDVTYTYQPFISAGFQFPNLGIYATLPPTTIHRRALMRTIQ